MIRVAQASVEVPAALAEKGIGPRERKRAIDFYESATGKKVSFAAYSDRSVKEALFQLFHGKCAYCEGMYDATQPVDVEHWRPKGGFENDQGKLEEPGYYWLAADWTNLLPSCIDCNRQRAHTVLPTGEERKIGKANQFPLADPAKRARRSVDRLEDEDPLLLNPYLHAPEEVLEVDEEEGVLTARPGVDPKDARRAQASLEVYALNRTELVQARKALILRLRARMHTVTQLVRLLEHADVRGETQELIEDLLTHELHDLWSHTLPDRPYSLTARRVVGRFVEEMTGRPAFREVAERG